ncbi:glutamate racemase [Dinghuibacter silviterrae]|uniref:Glutamate racemase n=1 Tax=Dinghuibacter silviterrae TaxID=1539049 RepID=A0A4R8DNZ7_9BACT|nr:glutamate racemase [Dinghuibacter silviterrae]TDW99427.1 glutamate racemase [Dinghuibacter silviterrae]
MQQGPIGVFDSGYGGLTVLKEFVRELPAYDYLYLGDNARAPYGGRSFETVYHYTLECVRHLFDLGCPLVILACNTASAKALRTIQQNDLPRMSPDNRVLGVIRPTTEIVGQHTITREVGVLGTVGTVTSESYPIEINKFYPDVKVYQQACPLWVPLVENGEADGEGADYFVKKYLDQLMAQSPHIDTLVLGCTHYPLLVDKIRAHVPEHMRILSQGEIVARSLADYLSRHPSMEARLSRGGSLTFYTTETPASFERLAGIFFDQAVKANHLDVGV